MSLDILSLKDFDFNEKIVFLRLDLNSPIEEGKIKNDFRIKKSLPSISYLLENNARLIIGTHLGRPEKKEKKYSVSLIALMLQELLDIEVILMDEVRSEALKVLSRQLKNNQIILLENLRFDPSELENKKDLSDFFTDFIDIYVNDAFGVCHRKHCSIDLLPRSIKKNKAIGLLMEKEIEALEEFLSNKRPPLSVILGGKKISDKIELIERCLDISNYLMIGGAMAFTFLKAKGVSVGDSFVEKEKLDFAKNFLERVKLRKKAVFFPMDHVVCSSENPSVIKTTKSEEIPEGFKAFDIGPKTIELFSSHIRHSKSVLWNGPLGFFENEAYKEGSKKLALEVSSSDIYSFIGGGDSLRMIDELNLTDQITHLSTGGGAILEYIKSKNLAGLEALKIRK